jgi:hypothetical protein
MKFRGSRILYRWVIIVSVGALLIVIVFLFLPLYLEHVIREKIDAQHVESSDIHVNLFTRSVHIKNLEWSSIPDTLNSAPHYVRINTLAIEGISLYPLLIHKKIRVNEIVIDSGTVKYNISIQHIQKEFTSEYKTFECKAISLNTIETQVMADTLVRFSALLTLHLYDAIVTLDSANTITYSLKNSKGIGQGMNFNRH